MLKSNNQLTNKTKETKNLYLDYAAGASPNASSIHNVGVKAKRDLRAAREKVANLLGARAEDLIFTSGGTESNNLALQGVVAASRKKILPHMITTNIEHPSVLETFKILKDRGLAQITIVPVEHDGVVNPKKIKDKIKNNTVLVSVIYANNEIGTIQPIKEIGKIIRHYKKVSGRKDIFFHTDAVQAVGYLDMNVERLGIDLISLSGSKIPGAGRVGVLYKRNQVSLSPIWGGGDQEMGLRPGTENLSAIIEFAQALETLEKSKEKEIKRLTDLQKYFLKELFKLPGGIILNGDSEKRLPNNINITWPGIPSDLLVIELSARGIMTSSKSACKSSSKEGSYVIRAIHPETKSDIGGIRFSFGPKTSKSDIDYTVRELSKILSKLEKWY